MNRLLLAAAAVLALSSAAHSAPLPADPARPAADVARDTSRKPAEMVALATLKPGDQVLEMLPGGGYFTRIFSKVVGPTGRIYAAVPDAGSRDAEPAAAKIAAEPGYGNITVTAVDAKALVALKDLDVIWTSQNYHDFHLSRLKLNVAATDRLLFSLLKPGGVLVVVDHAALPGAPVGETADKLHRIDVAAVEQELTAAGFVLEAQSDALKNSTDPHTANVFDPVIRGKTDQFALRFRKPR